jgi:hypothetical protein
MKKRTSLEADFAQLMQPDSFINPDNHWHWSGWKNYHWPASVARPGFRFYAFNPHSRRLEALMEVTKGRAFGYLSKEDFARQAKKVTGWSPDRSDPHWSRIPRAGTGIAIRFRRLPRRVDIPLSIKFPQLGWLALNEAALKGSALDFSDLIEEGDRTLQTHLKVERNAKLRAAARAYWRDKLGVLRCSVCNFDFARQYGVRGADFIEMHHVKPVSKGKAKRTTKDLVPVCSNCHRMLHRGEMLTLNELRKIVRS